LLRSGQFAKWAAELRHSTANQHDLGLRIKRMIELSLSPRLQQDVQRILGKWWSRPEMRSPLSKDAIARGGLDERMSRHSRSWSNARLQQGLRARMIAFADPGVDVAGTLARHGFELRDPTADRRFVDFCLGVPLDQFQREGKEKLLVRRLMRGVLPPAMLDSTSRGLQGVGWLRNMHFGQAEIRQEVHAMRASALGSRLLDLDTLEDLANRIPDGGPTNMADIASFRHKLLHGAAAACFIRYVEGRNA
jgi:asparagine synthase (glutamine-hydrolysing)